MIEKQIQEVTVKVLKRLLPQLGANGQSGTVIVVFSGATAGFTEAVQQVRSLIMKGYQVQLVFSQGAENLYANLVWEQLEGFPYVSPFETSKWLRTLKEACAVVVPMLSVNTLSKLSLLIADNLASNLVLHALFVGLPVVLAQNGVDPSDKGRIELHFDKSGPELSAAIEERLQVVRSYGCRVTDVGQVVAELEAAFAPAAAAPRSNGQAAGATLTALDHKTSIVTAADVLKAHQAGTQLRLRSSTVITPLARELATKHGVGLLQGSSG